MKEQQRYDIHQITQLDAMLPSDRRDALFVLSREFDDDAEQVELEEKEIGSEIREALGDDADPKVFYYAYQRGVDWETIVIAIAAIFMAGPKFRDALQAWGEMAKNVVGLWSRLGRKRNAVVFFHPSVAGAIAMGWLQDKGNRGQEIALRVLAVSEVTTYRAPLPDDPFRYTPERLYLVAVEEAPTGSEDVPQAGVSRLN